MSPPDRPKDEYRSAQREGTPVSPPHDYDDIPGTVVFDARRCRQGYHLNMFFMSLMKADNRAAFKADEHAFMAGFPLTAEQRDAVLARDWNGMLGLGGNIFFMVKLAFCDGLSVLKVAAAMTGSTPEAYAAMMQAGGRSIDGNRSKAQGPHG